LARSWVGNGEADSIGHRFAGICGTIMNGDCVDVARG
jgi:hypothetical protein